MRRYHHPGRESKQRQRRIKDPMGQPAEPALPHGHAQVVMLTGMMNHMKVPEESHLVAEAVEPVIHQVVEQKYQPPGPPRGRRNPQGGKFIKCRVNEEMKEAEERGPEQA